MEDRKEESKDVTQVQTLQQMNLQQGNEAPQTMNQEQFEAQIALQHRYGAQASCEAFANLSRKGMIRLWNATHELPMEGMPVKLNGDLEKQIYLASQKTLMAKHVMVFNRAKKEHIAEEIALAKRKEREQNEKVEETKSQENTSLDSNG